MMAAMSHRHAAAVIGGAVAGAEIARALAEAGAYVAVFEQNERPFGKIEDGLPRWHSALRNTEYGRIKEKLSHPDIDFVPKTKIGRDLSFEQLVGEEGFSLVVLACGAWRDRRLPVDGAEHWVDRGLVYQNPFIIAFNRADAPLEAVVEGALVIGGGLASIDVCKVMQLDGVRKKLLERGIDVDIEEMEKAGIHKTLELHGLSVEEIGLEPATLCYRREAEDMPLLEMPAGADEARQEKVKRTRARALDKAMGKFGFRFQPLCKPEALVGGERLEAVRFRRLKKNERGRLEDTDETFDLKTRLVVSSIGSIPDPIDGVEMKGELFDFSDEPIPRLEGHRHVFAVGNVVTGKGNIIASRRHASQMAERLLDTFLGLEGDHDEEVELADSIEADAKAHAHTLVHEAKQLPRLSPERVGGLRAQVQARQEAVGYEGLSTWLR